MPTDALIRRFAARLIEAKRRGPVRYSANSSASMANTKGDVKELLDEMDRRLDALEKKSLARPDRAAIAIRARQFVAVARIRGEQLRFEDAMAMADREFAGGGNQEADERDVETVTLAAQIARIARSRGKRISFDEAMTLAKSGQH